MAVIEYWYSAHSAYAYLGHAELLRVASATGRTVEHRPVDLRRVLDGVSVPNFRTRAPAHLSYFFGRHMRRWAEERGIPMMATRPSTHDENGANMAPSNGLLIAAIAAGADVDALAGALLKGHWVDDADVNDPATVTALAASVGIDAAPLLEKALSPEVQAIHEENTAEAIRREIFGSPTYFVDGDMFYGQDMLHMVERACFRPYA